MSELQKLIDSALVDADHLALMSEKFLEAINKKHAARERCDFAETAVNVHELEKAEASVSEYWQHLRSAAYEYRKRAQRYRDSLRTHPAEALPEPVADGLLRLDVLLAEYHEAVWTACAGEGVAYDDAGVKQAKAIQSHVRELLSVVSKAKSRFVCADCFAPVRDGYTCDCCDSFGVLEVVGSASNVVSSEPVGEMVLEDMGRPFNAMAVRVNFYDQIPPVGTKLYTSPEAARVPADVARNAARYQWLREKNFHFSAACDTFGISAEMWWQEESHDFKELVDQHIDTQISAAAPHRAAIKRRAFICPSCSGVYADEPVTQCDCMNASPAWIHGEISYLPSSAVSDATVKDFMTVQGERDMDLNK